MRHLGLAFQKISWRVVVASTALLVAPATAGSAWAQEQGQVFVANFFGGSVTRYALLANGDTPPAAVILEDTFDYPHQIAINHRTDELIVANNGLSRVSIYNRSTGTLKRTIQGNSTGLKFPTGVAVDETRGELYVANDGTDSITVYDALAFGDVSPKRTITSPAMFGPVGLAIDVVHDEILVSDFYKFIFVFERSANGPSEPTRQIYGGDLDGNQGIALDLNRDEILVANSSNAGAILTFNRTTLTQVRKLESATSLCNPYSVAIDYLKDEIVVANANFGGACQAAVTTYDRGASGNVAAKRKIAGASTMLNSPTSAAIFYGGTLGVANKAASANVDVGTRVIYNITATATGGAILGATLADTLPTSGGLTWTVAGTDAAGCTLADDYKLTCSFGNLAKGQSKSIKVTSSATSVANCSSAVSNQVTSTYNDGTAILSGASSLSTVNVKCK